MPDRFPRAIGPLVTAVEASFRGTVVEESLTGPRKGEYAAVLQASKAPLLHEQEELLRSIHASVPAHNKDDTRVCLKDLQK
jgi:hypothetical protein